MLIAVAWPTLLLGPVAVAIAACGSEARDAALRELAVGSWACAPDAEGSGERPFTVRIDDDGTFGVSVESDPTSDDVGLPTDEIAGTWVIDNGDLEWGFDEIRIGRMVVADFDALTLESTRFTLENGGFFEANDGFDDPPDEQDVEVDIHSTDSVTLTVPGGKPWTCDRQ